MSAPGTLEVRVYETTHITRLVAVHLAGECGALGAQVMVALEEITFEVTDLKNLHRLKGDPELVRPRHLHFNTTTWKERDLSLTNLEGANSSSVELPRAKFHVQRLVAYPERHPRPRFEKDLDAVSHFAHLLFGLGTLLELKTLYYRTLQITNEKRNSASFFLDEFMKNFSFLLLTESGISFCPENSVRFGRLARAKPARGIDFSYVVPEGRVELPSLATHDFESCAYTNSATPAMGKVYLYFLKKSIFIFI